MGRKRLGEILLERGDIGADGLERALALGRDQGLRLGAALRELGLVPEDRLVAALAEALGLPVADVGVDDLDWTALHLLRPEFCEAHDLLPFALEEGRVHRVLRVAMADPLDVPAIDEIEFTTGLRVRPCLAGREAIRSALSRWLRRGRPAPEETGDDRMLLVRAGGVQELVSTEAGATGPTSRDAEVVSLDEEVELPPAPSGGRFALDPPPRTTAVAPVPAFPPERRRAVADDLAFLTGDEGQPDDAGRLARLEARHEALVRLLARKGLLEPAEVRSLLE